MESEILPQGVIYMYAQYGGNNTEVPREVVAVNTRKVNSPEHLESEFFSTSPAVLVSRKFSDGEISVIKPSAPYVPFSLMVIAKGNNSFDFNPISTQSITATKDFPLDLQASYWGTVYNLLTAMEAIRKRHNDPLRYKALASMNWLSTYSNEKYRTSQSIGLPHAHVMLVDRQDITPEKFTIPHAKAEQRLIKRMRGFMGDIFDGMDRLNGFHQSFEVTSKPKLESPPIGYEFILKGDINNLSLAAFMRDHHQAYFNLALPIYNSLSERVRERIIPPPSYRLYMYLNEDSINVTISPEFRSHAGVLEAGGQKLLRGPQYQQLKSPEEVAQFYTQVLAFQTKSAVS